MVDVFGYELSDFLAFAPETYWRLFDRMNRGVWPLQVPLLMVLAGSIVAAIRCWRYASFAVASGLAAGWALTTQVFLASHYLPINWAIAWVVPWAWAQVAVLLVLVPGLRFIQTRRTLPALFVTVFALCYPIVGLAFGRPLAQVEIAGLAPDPTMLLTLGLLGLAQPGWRRLVLAVLPVAWCLISTATLLTMEEPSGFVLVAALVVALFGLFRPSRRAWAPR